MNKAQRIRDVVLALLTIAGSVAMMLIPDVGYYVMLVFLSISLIVAGLQKIVYYFTMARHMVGGASVFYTGIVLYDLGLLSWSVSNIPAVYIMLYLFAVHFFSGLVSILRAREAKLLDAESWKIPLASGIADVMVAVLCMVFMGSMRTAVYLYGAGLIYSAILRLVSALRRTDIIYIP